MKNLVMAAAAVALMTATPAQAVTRQIDFSFDVELTPVRGTSSRRSWVETFSGSFTFDDSSFGAAGRYGLQPFLQSFSYGTKSWDLDEVPPIASNIAFDALGQVISWYFYISGPDGRFSLSTSGYTFFHPTGANFSPCGNCASFQEVPVSMSAVPVPLPAGIGLLAAGLGGLGVIGVRRRKTA